MYQGSLVTEYTTTETLKESLLSATVKSPDTETRSDLYWRSTERLTRYTTETGDNLTTVLNLTEINSKDFPSDWVIYLSAVIGIFVSLLGLFGNSMTIAAYKRNRKLRTTFNFLIINLCTVDLLFSALLIPTHVPMMLSKRDPYGSLACRVFGYLFYCSVSSSAVNLVCIAINRYVGIVHSKRYRYMFGNEYAKWWVVGIWTLVPLIYLPLVIGNSIEWRDSSLRCDLLTSGHDGIGHGVYQIFLIVSLQGLPVVALTVFYRAILRKVKKCRKTVEHYPLTNTPSNCGSYMGHTGGGRSPASPDINAQHVIKTTRIPSRNSINHDNVINNDDADDVNAGRKAIIMAYLQVPPTSISPRKSPGALYKRSPPQTRTMVVEQDEGGGHQVLISGTTSSPNLTKEKETTFVSETRRSALKWCRQRSFSTGDEEFEPERGMIGDDESDLKQMSSFNISCPVSKAQSPTDAYTAVQTGSGDMYETPETKSENGSPYSSTNDTAILVPKSPDPVRSEDEAHAPKLKTQSVVESDDQEVINSGSGLSPGVETDEITTSSQDSGKRKLRRQKVIEDDEIHNNNNNTLMLPQTKCNSPLLAPTKITNQDHPKQLILPKIEKPQFEITRPILANYDSPVPSRGDKTRVSIRKSNLVDSNAKRAKYARKPKSTSSDKGYASQTVEFTTPIIEKVTSEQSLKDEEIFPEPRNAISKRIVYRRGASDSGGVLKFRKFRKSKNWSVTSTKPSKYRVRRTSTARRDTVIKIVIDHVTEEDAESSIEGGSNLTHSPAKSSTKDNLTDESTPTVQGSSTCNAISNNCETKLKTRQNFLKRWFSTNPFAGRNFNSPLIKMSKLVMRSPSASHSTNHGKDEGVGTIDECSDRSSPKAALSPGSSVWSGMDNYDSSQKSVTMNHKPAILLPMPNLPLRTNDTALPQSQKNPLHDDYLSDIPFMDSDDTCRNSSCLLHNRQLSVESENASSRLGSMDSELLSAKEDADLLEKRRNMNASSQFLRVHQTAHDCDSDNADCRSVVDACSIDLGRRWSGQSDAISIYSERVASMKRPVERSHSACSRTLSRKSSKKSEAGSFDRGSRKKSLYRKFSASKKSSLTSSGGSTGRRRTREAERKLANSGIMICIAFAFFMLPSSALDILHLTSSVIIPAEVKLFAIVLSWLHVIANPFLYGFLNSQFRSEYKKILRDIAKFYPRSRKNRGLIPGKSALVKTMRQQYSINTPAQKNDTTTKTGATKS